MTCPRCAGEANPTGWCPDCRAMVDDVPPVAPAIDRDASAASAPAGASDQVAGEVAGATGETSEPLGHRP